MPPASFGASARPQPRLRTLATAFLAAFVLVAVLASTSERPAGAASSPNSAATDVAGLPIAFGAARTTGGAPSSPTAPVVGIVAAPRGAGYWIVAASGGVFTFDGATFHGSMGNRRLRKPVVGMAATTDGKGYWLVASDGGVFTFGDANYHGSMGGRALDKPIVGMAASADGTGYWLVASDGGVFSFGDAHFYGSAAPDRPLGAVTGMAPGPNGAGYWLGSVDGGVYSFGDARFHGSAPATQLSHPITAIAATPDGAGYWLLPTTPPPPPPVAILPPGFVAGHITDIGDSVTVDAQPDLQSDIPGIDVEAVVGRQWDEGVQVAQTLRAESSLGAIVVIDLGTNGPVTIAQFQNMMAALAGATRVVFVTVHLPPSYSWSQSVNATLEQGVRMYANARLADFNALTDQHPEWFGPDGVHMAVGGPGAQALASLIAATV